MQIEGMVDRICGLFPTTQIGRNTVKNAWTVDDPASLRELHNIFRKVRGLGSKNQPIETKCDICNGMLWDDGIRYSEAGQRISEQYEQEENGHIYKVVRPCPNCRGSDWRMPES